MLLRTCHILRIETSIRLSFIVHALLSKSYKFFGIKLCILKS
jgi:hypothetical protein